jgi:hypothetical protein
LKVPFGLDIKMSQQGFVGYFTQSGRVGISILAWSKSEQHFGRAGRSGAYSDIDTDLWITLRICCGEIYEFVQIAKTWG